MKVLFKLICILSYVLSIANAKELVVWSETDLPPIFIVEGNDSGNGYAQKVIKEIQNELSSYTHIIEENTIARSLKLLENTDYSCYSLLWSEKRAKYTLYSKALFLTFPNGIIIRKEDKSKYLQYLDVNGDIDLDKLFLDEDMIFGRVNKMEFGKFINNKINKYSHTMNISYFNNQSNLVKMFAFYKRVDYIIAYYSNVQFQIKKLEISKDLEYIKIKGMKIHPAYIGCSKSKLGEDIISKINEVAIKHRSNKYLDFVTPYLDKNQIKYLKENADKLFNEYDKIILNKE